MGTITREAQKERLQPEGYIEKIEIKERLSDIRIRENLAWTCIGIVCFSILATYTVIFLVGFGIMNGLSDSFLHWLGGATIGTIISNILIVYRSMFPTKDSRTLSEEEE